jgi:hypothetical protein
MFTFGAHCKLSDPPKLPFWVRWISGAPRNAEKPVNIGGLARLLRKFINA